MNESSLRRLIDKLNQVNVYNLDRVVEEVIEELKAENASIEEQLGKQMTQQVQLRTENHELRSLLVDVSRAIRLKDVSDKLETVTAALPLGVAERVQMHARSGVIERGLHEMGVANSSPIFDDCWPPVSVDDRFIRDVRSLVDAELRRQGFTASVEVTPSRNEDNALSVRVQNTVDQMGNERKLDLNPLHHRLNAFSKRVEVSVVYNEPVIKKVLRHFLKSDDSETFKTRYLGEWKDKPES